MTQYAIGVVGQQVRMYVETATLEDLSDQLQPGEVFVAGGKRLSPAPELRIMPARIEQQDGDTYVIVYSSS